MLAVRDPYPNPPGPGRGTSTQDLNYLHLLYQCEKHKEEVLGTFYLGEDVDNPDEGELCCLRVSSL